MLMEKESHRAGRAVTMTILAYVFLALNCVESATAQNASETQPPGIQILKHEWSKVTPLPRGWDRPIYSPSEPGTGRNGSLRRFPRGPREPIFLYSVKIKNAGQKVITGIAWEYLVNDLANDSELSRHSFWNWEKMGTAKTKTIEGRSPSPPSNVVSVTGLQKDERSPFVEKVLLKCVLYEDGTTWAGPESTERDCQRLKLGPRHRGR